MKSLIDTRRKHERQINEKRRESQNGQKKINKYRTLDEIPFERKKK